MKTHQILTISAVVLAISSPALLLAEPAAPATAPNQAAQAPAKAVPALSPDSVAAVFNGREIKIAEVDAEIQRKPAFAMWQSMGDEDPTLKNKVRLAALNGMINRSLLLGASKASGSVDEKEVEKSVAGLVQNYGGKDKLIPLVKAIGSTYEQFTSEVADDFRITTYIDKVLAKDLKLSDADIKKHFDENPNKFVEGERVHVSHILIKLDPNASAEQDKAAQDKINDLYKKVTGPGADFAAVAKESSQCPSAPMGGDLGVIGRGKTVPAFEQVAFKLKPGEISKPVRSQFGYHIIKVSEHIDADKPDFNKAKPAVEKELVQQQKAKLIETKVNELRGSAQIKINLAA